MPKRPKAIPANKTGSVVLSARVPVDLKRDLIDLLHQHSGPGGFANLSHAVEYYLFKGIESEGLKSPDSKTRAARRAYTDAQRDAYAAIGSAIKKLIEK